MPLTITEGEIDALTVIDCGFPLTVSVPDGAPPVRDGEDPDHVEPPDPAREHTGKFEFIWNNRERLRPIRRFIIATDADLPGRRLAAELVSRLSASRCLFVTYPEGCKDLNEVRTRHGPEAVAAVLSGARPYPVRGLYTLEDYPETESVRTFSTGWPTLDRHLQVFAGEFMVITGIPGRGKSTWLLNLLCNLAELHGWRSAVFSREMPTVPHLRDKLRRIRDRGPIDRLNAARLAELDAFINEYFVFIDADPTGQNDEDFDLAWLLERVADAVYRHGIKVAVIDPWNEIEHARRRDETMTDYVGRSIREIKRFARLYNIIVIVVTHPTKDVARGGESRPPSLYDIADSAHWFNKPDHGVVIDWPDAARPESTISVAKVRFEESGKIGEVRMRFDELSNRFEMLRPL
jgi:twinkle protein